MDEIRLLSQQTERETLSSFAALSENSKGRKVFEEPCPIRTDYQRDRDRIIHSRAFRRLKHKTQVFLSPESDHYRTRLTHTLEVSQISRTVARALRLNEDLTEAIALGHDLGHTPFGHAGERALDSISPCGFTHFEQSVRVCEKLEKSGKGLNLTFEVVDGILNHTKGDLAETAEGRIVRLCDHIAYMNHDIDDAIRAGVLSFDEIPKDIVEFLGKTKSERITALVGSLIKNSQGLDIKFDEQTHFYYEKLHKFMYDAVYSNKKAKAEEEKVEGIIRGIYDYLLKNPEAMSGEYQLVRENEGIERAVTDYIAGMTDHFAVTTYSDIYIPKSWNL
ncbi:MAG: deoxyguanosinetriphosphate triphosphohydrolase [Clostridia bacterium]|nr:deoxyguanosinetriphosphate triphosphohydrolase [Clostridia bacterium]